MVCAGGSGREAGYITGLCRLLEEKSLLLGHPGTSVYWDICGKQTGRHVSHGQVSRPHLAATYPLPASENCSGGTDHFRTTFPHPNL